MLFCAAAAAAAFCTAFDFCEANIIRERLAKVCSSTKWTPIFRETTVIGSDFRTKPGPVLQNKIEKNWLDDVCKLSNRFLDSVPIYLFEKLSKLPISLRKHVFKFLENFCGIFQIFSVPFMNDENQMFLLKAHGSWQALGTDWALLLSNFSCKVYSDFEGGESS